MKLKDRFRKALFHFFKDEIMEFTHAEKPIPFVVHEVKFEHLKITHDFELSPRVVDTDYFHKHFESSLTEMRKDLFNKALPFFKIDEEQLLSPEYRYKRKFSISLYVGKPMEK